MERMFVVKGVHSSEDGPSSASVDGLFTEEQAKECLHLRKEENKLWNEIHADDRHGWFSSSYEIVELSVETGAQSIFDAKNVLAKVRQEKEDAERYVPPPQPKNLGTLGDFFPKPKT
jgi:hypothetical protein